MPVDEPSEESRSGLLNLVLQRLSDCVSFHDVAEEVRWHPARADAFPSTELLELAADRHPWAVELKDQDAGGGHGAYLRHGVGQAVLYRHFIQSATALDPWFSLHHLDRPTCRAALAFPTAATGAAKAIQRLRDLAKRYSVEVIEFPRPGSGP